MHDALVPSTQPHLYWARIIMGQRRAVWLPRRRTPHRRPAAEERPRNHAQKKAPGSIAIWRDTRSTRRNVRGPWSNSPIRALSVVSQCGGKRVENGRTRDRRPGRGTIGGVSISRCEIQKVQQAGRCSGGGDQTSGRCGRRPSMRQVVAGHARYPRRPSTTTTTIDGYRRRRHSWMTPQICSPLLRLKRHDAKAPRKDQYIPNLCICV